MDDEAQSSNTENIETSVEFVNLIDDIQEIKIDSQDNLSPIIYQGYIYELVNMENKKHYVGMSTRHYDTRIEEHLRGSGSKKIKEEIKRYGKQAFIKNVLEVITKHSLLDLTQELFLREAFWIKEKDTFINGYNSNQGSTFRNCDSLLNYIYRGDVKVLGEKINDQRTPNDTQLSPVKVEKDTDIEHSPPLKKIKLEKPNTQPEISGEDVIDTDDSSQECPNNEPETLIATPQRLSDNLPSQSNALVELLKQIKQATTLVKNEKGSNIKEVATNKLLDEAKLLLVNLLEEVDNLKIVSDKRLQETSLSDTLINIFMHSTTTNCKGARCSVGKFALTFCKALQTFKKTKGYKKLDPTSLEDYKRLLKKNCIKEITKLSNEGCSNIVSKNHTDTKREFAGLLHQWKIIDIPAKNEKGKGGSGLSILNRQMREEPLSDDILSEVLLV
jgi:group I intron endonuclease